MRYGEMLAVNVQNVLAQVYDLGNAHAQMCGEDEVKVLHDAVKENVISLITDTVINVKEIGERMDLMVAKLQELGIDPETLWPVTETTDEPITMEVIPTANGVPVTFIEG